MRVSGFTAFAGLVLTGASLIAVPSAAQNALRAPLSIVPPPMQAAIEQAAQADAPAKQQARLAPRNAARQMKRAVRAVAATPGAEGDVVQIGQLGALEDAPVGLETGFGDTLWTGARLAFVVDQMARLPADLAMPALYDLERRLHRGATAAPIGTVDKTSWFAARLMRLLRLGDTQSVIALEAQTGAALSDGYVAQVLALAHLGRGDRAAACAVPRPARGVKGRRDTLSFFMQMLVYCQLFEGAYEKAGLTLELNEKTLGEDALFRDMAYLMAAQVPLRFGTKEEADAADKEGAQAPLVLPDELTPMQIALLQLAGQPLPQGLINLPHYFMQAVAMDFAQSPLVQLHAAQLAVRHGASPEVFSQAAQLADLSAFSPAAPAEPPRAAIIDRQAEAENPTDVGAEADAAIESEDARLPPPVFLAQALRIVDATEPPAQPRLMATYLRAAQARGLWHDAVRIFDDRLAALLVPQAAAIEALPDDASRSNEMPFSPNGSDTPATNNPGPDDAAALARAPSPEPLALAEADRLVLLLAHWQAGHQAAAQNLMRLAPLGDDLTRLARWQGFGVAPDAALEGTDIATAAPDTLIDTLPPLAAPAMETDETPTGTFDAGSEVASEVQPELAPEGVPDLSLDLQPDWVAFEARLSSAGAAEGVYLRRQLALYHALGVALPETLMLDLVLPEADPLAQRLARLADNKWIGDLILAQIGELADKPAASYDAADTMLLIGNLRRAGLQAAAEKLAGDMLLSHSVHLAVTAPHVISAAALADMPLAPPAFQSQIFSYEPVPAGALEAGSNGG